MLLIPCQNVSPWQLLAAFMVWKHVSAGWSVRTRLSAAGPCLLLCLQGCTVPPATAAKTWAEIDGDCYHSQMILLTGNVGSVRHTELTLKTRPQCLAAQFWPEAGPQSLRWWEQWTHWPEWGPCHKHIILQQTRQGLEDSERVQPCSAFSLDSEPESP